MFLSQQMYNNPQAYNYLANMWSNYQQMSYNGLSTLISENPAAKKPTEELSYGKNIPQVVNSNFNTEGLKYDLKELQPKPVVENPSSS
jgi:hypothetical protein